MHDDTRTPTRPDAVELDAEAAVHAQLDRISALLARIEVAVELLTELRTAGPAGSMAPDHPGGLAEFHAAALPKDAPGAWIKEAIERHAKAAR